MRVKVMLHGFIKEKLGRDYIETNAKTAFEAVSAIGNGYRKELKAPLDIGRWKVRVRDYETKEKLMGLIRHNVIHLYPDFRTAKSGLGNIIAGVVLIVVGAVLDYFFPGNPISSYCYQFGIGMMLSGALQYLFTPTVNTSSDESTNSKYLNGANANTTAAGTRIPFGYGLFRVAGHYISYNVTSSILRTVEA